MLTHIAHHIFWTARPTNFKLGIRMEDDDPHQPQVPWPPRSKFKVARSRDQSEPSLANIVPVSLVAGGGIPCRLNPATTLLGLLFRMWLCISRHLTQLHKTYFKKHPIHWTWHVLTLYNDYVAWVGHKKGHKNFVEILRVRSPKYGIPARISVTSNNTHPPDALNRRLQHLHSHDYSVHPLWLFSPMLTLTSLKQTLPGQSTCQVSSGSAQPFWPPYITYTHSKPNTLCPKK